MRPSLLRFPGLLLTLLAGVLFSHPLSARSLADFRIDNPTIGGDFALTAQDGRKLALTELREKVVLLAFGYTHCPDICPTTVSTMQRLLKGLGKQAAAARMVFITVDPQRDTPSVLKRYLAFFDPRIIGLTGILPELKAMASRYRTFFQRNETHSQGGYLVDHTGYYYLIDTRGRLAYLFPHDIDPDILLQGIKTLIPR